MKDPNMGEWKVEVGKKVKLHCIFLGWNMERAWLQENEFKKFVREDAGEGRIKKYRVRLKELDVLMSHLVKNIKKEEE